MWGEAIIKSIIIRIAVSKGGLESSKFQSYLHTVLSFNTFRKTPIKNTEKLPKP
uniref:Uncharacterized protein n=1 Tax=Salix viminalis TaxID=40686 RepID=A0A6N2NF32_SALVM